MRSEISDTMQGLQVSGATPEEPSIPKPGEQPKPPQFKRIEPQRIFRNVRVPAHELAMVKQLEALKASGASEEKIRPYRALVNRVLLDRLMVDHWDRAGYLTKSQIVGRGLKLIGLPDQNRLPFIMGTDIPPIVPAPTELLRLETSIPKDVKTVERKPSSEGTPNGTPKRPFVIPDDFNPLTHEVVYDKDGNPIGVRKKEP